MQKFHSHGKLLITGEYAVLDGATAFALPTQFGQSLEVEPIIEPVLKWRSLDHKGETWFEEEFLIKDLLQEGPVPIGSGPGQKKVSKMLFLTLHSAAKSSPAAFNKTGHNITTKTDFPLEWGLGTSSTLIANIAQWLKIDAYELLEKTFGGSGYDVAVALQEQPIAYTLQEGQKKVFATGFDPKFKDNLFFVHLNQKQDSRKSIEHYKNQDKATLSSALEKITSITHQIISCENLLEFNLLLEVHENIISQLTGLQKVKTRLFPDYKGAVKSLGGWGGDFVLATGEVNDIEYFRNKGYHTVVPYSKMIL